MKISYRTHPVLKYLETGKIPNHEITCNNADIVRFMSFKRALDPIWANGARLFRQNIRYLTNPFVDALMSACTKMVENKLILGELGKDSSGTFFLGPRTLCYSITNYPDNKVKVIYFEFAKTIGHDIPILAKFFSKNEVDGTLYSYYARDEHEPGREIKSDYLTNDARIVSQSILSIITFIKYAQVQTKQLEPGKKIKELSCSYLNDTKSSVQYLDSRWFTNLVKSDAFKVRGHFRLQPKKKDGEWTKELIWINEFQKEGYTAPARKLQSQD